MSDPTDPVTGPADPDPPAGAGTPGSEIEQIGLGNATCYRHDGRRASARCRRCERAICPDCMVQAAVGWQCPECVRTWSRKMGRGQPDRR